MLRLARPALPPAAELQLELCRQLHTQQQLPGSCEAAAATAGLVRAAGARQSFTPGGCPLASCLEPAPFRPPGQWCAEFALEHMFGMCAKQASCCVQATRPGWRCCACGAGAQIWYRPTRPHSRCTCGSASGPWCASLSCVSPLQQTFIYRLLQSLHSSPVSCSSPLSCDCQGSSMCS